MHLLDEEALATTSDAEGEKVRYWTNELRVVLDNDRRIELVGCIGKRPWAKAWQKPGAGTPTAQALRRWFSAKGLDINIGVKVSSAA